MEMLSHCRTPSHMFTSDPSPSVEQEGRERHKSNAQQRRDRDGAGHKSNALYCGDRGSEHVTNQSGFDGRVVGETNHANPISSAACPSAGRGGGGRLVVAAADIKKTE